MSLLHKSLDDFLTNQSRCGEDWFIDVNKQVRYLASTCTSIVTSFVAEPTVDEVDDKFRYASYFWIDFCCEPSPPEAERLSSMLGKYFFRWVCIALHHDVGATNGALISLGMLNTVRGHSGSDAV